MVGGTWLLNSSLLGERIGRQRHAPGAGDLDHFLVGGDEQRSHVGIVAQLADRLARQRHHAGVGGEQHELHPEVGEDLIAQGASKPAFWHSARKSPPRWLRWPSSSPNIMRMKVPTWRDHAGRGDRGRDLRHAAHHGALAEDRISRSRASMPFCSGMTAVLGPDQRLDALAGAFDVPQLDAEQHEIDRADRGGIVGGLGGRRDGCRRAGSAPSGRRSSWRPDARRARGTLTSAPAFASAAPNPPPTPPAPTTAIRINLSP